MEEPSVLDYLKSKIMPWKYPRVEIPELPAEPAQQPSGEPPSPASALADQESPPFSEVQAQPEPPTPAAVPEQPPTAAQLEPAAVQLKRIAWPVQSLLALTLAMLAQQSLAPRPGRSWVIGVILLAGAALLWLLARWRDEWQDGGEQERQEATLPRINILSLEAGLVFAALAFLGFGSMRFSWFNLGLLALAVAFIVLAFWLPERRTAGPGNKLSRLFSRRPWSLHLSLSAPLVWGILLVAGAAFFRFYRLAEVPPEMNSDHAEKILDISRVLAGQAMIFFPSNGGREALQFYLSAGLHRLLHLPLDFNLLKLVTASVGFLSLPFIYLLGKEMGSRRAGVLAFMFAAVAYWPNVVSRIGLRLPFYMLFTAALLYYLLRGMRTSRRGDFILAGICLGLSLYGYTADRVLPLLALAAVGLYLLHRQSKGLRLQTLVSLLALVLVSLVLFLPMLRYILAEPEVFFYRTLSRVADLERPLEAPVWIVFLSNTWNALKMFSWDAGQVWPISVPGYPALGMVSGGLFYLGVVLALVRYLRRRSWLDLFWLVSIPILLLPSIMALAFPVENPNLYRTGGAMVPVFLLVGLALDHLMRALQMNFRSPWGSRLAWGLAMLLFGLSCLQDYDMVFNKYYQQYRLSAWNTSEMGQVVQSFGETMGSYDTVWVVGFPHWADTRLVGVVAGFPTRDFAIDAEALQTTTAEPRAKLFLLNPQDTQALSLLRALYPAGWLQPYTSQTPSKEFLLFYAPPTAP